MARKTIAYTVRLDFDLADWVEKEAKKRKWSLTDVIKCGVMLLKTTLEKREGKEKTK